MEASNDTPREEDDGNVFSSMGLRPELLENIASLGFTEPTPIQAAGIPPLLQGHDVIGRARTGSGKTAAFGLPLLHNLDRDARGVQALVLAPTRELALQVTEALRTFARGGPSIVTIYGGSPYAPQLRALRSGVPIVVGTPGRVIDHLERGSLDLSGLRMLVLDEADEMLRMGFIDDVERVLEAAADDRQVALFSATMPDPIRRVADRHLNEPVVVQVEEGKLSVDHIDQRWIRVPERFKLEALGRTLAAEERGATLVFARTRAACAELSEELGSMGMEVDALHGDLGQAARERVLGRMRQGRLDVLVATDVASRGLDVEHITHVVNYDIPDDAEVYVHRIGRTGRAGRAGTAITFVTPAQVRRLHYFCKQLDRRIPQAQVPSDADIARLRQLRLQRGVAATIDASEPDAMRAWVEAMADEEGWDPIDLATAALRMLTAPRGPLDFDPDTQAPAWCRPPSRPAPHHKNQRQPGPPRRDGPRRTQAQFDASNEVELFFAAGHSRGVRPADIVGALANEAGVPGGAIGRISIHDYKSFAGVPREIADRLLAAGSTLSIRGADVRMALAHGGQPPAGRPRRGRPGPRGPKRPAKR